MLHRSFFWIAAFRCAISLDGSNLLAGIVRSAPYYSHESMFGDGRIAFAVNEFKNCHRSDPLKNPENMPKTVLMKRRHHTNGHPSESVL
jgi:hypothetical protein